jgi:hypothetical protein
LTGDPSDGAGGLAGKEGKRHKVFPYLCSSIMGLGKAEFSLATNSYWHAVAEIWGTVLEYWTTDVTVSTRAPDKSAALTSNVISIPLF